VVSAGIEIVQDRRDSRSTLKGRIEVDGASVEIREFEWDQAGWVMSDRAHFYISQLISPLKGDQKIRWYHPEDNRPLSIAQFGVHDPHSPFLIAHGPGSACFLICEIDVARFRKMTGTDRWPDEWALRGLSSESPFFKVILDRLTGEVLRPHKDSPAFVDALITAFVLELYHVVQREQAAAEKDGALADWQLDRVRSLIHSHGGRPLTITEIAKRCGISVRHLTRAFRAAQGMTLHDYMAEARLAKAKELLSEGKMPLKVVAAEAGFASPSHFAATFRRALGCSPSEYRANVRIT